MLLIQGTKGNTLTPSFLASGDTSKELMRIAYVAMTRPRKLLVVAMPKSTVDLSGRFPADKWEYIELV
jgi:superfamily I DNA/RNA helicase